MSDDQLLDVLGQRLVRDVRDRVISSYAEALGGRRRGLFAAALKTQTDTLDGQGQAVVQALIPQVVDDVLVTLLQVLGAEIFRVEEERELKLAVRLDGGTWVDSSALSDGLDAEYAGEAGWVERFSRETGGRPA